jgi:hypothetical protein
MGWGGSWLGTGGRPSARIYIHIYIYIYYIYNTYIYILYITPIIINLWSSELVTSKHQQWIQLIMDITNNTTKWTHIDERCGHLPRQWSVFGKHVAPMCLAIYICEYDTVTIMTKSCCTQIYPSIHPSIWINSNNSLIWRPISWGRRRTDRTMSLASDMWWPLPRTWHNGFQGAGRMMENDGICRNWQIKCILSILMWQNTYN